MGTNHTHPMLQVIVRYYLKNDVYTQYMCEIRILAFVLYQCSYIFQAIRDEKQHDRIWPAKRKLSSAKSLSSLHDAADRGKY